MLIKYIFLEHFIFGNLFKRRCRMFAEIRRALIKIAIGGGIYYLLEMIVRGRSHWTMMLLGGACFFLCGIIHEKTVGKILIWQQMVLCMIGITILELAAGIIVNLFLGWDVWNYSTMPFQVMGQICVPFMFLWYIISYPAIILNEVFDNILQKQT